MVWGEIMLDQASDEGVQGNLADIYLDRLYVELEGDFALYEQGRITISEYAELVEVKIEDFERQRTAHLGVKEHIRAWFDRIRGRQDRWQEAADALEWCRGWARDRRHAEISACLQSAEACCALSGELLAA